MIISMIKINKITFLLYPSLQQKPHSQFLSPKDSQLTIFMFLFVIILISYFIYLKKIKVLLCKIIKIIKNHIID